VPPHGQRDIQGLKSIFEVSHLRDHAIFLNVQCNFFSYSFSLIQCYLFILDRMPPQIGSFISVAVYDGRLDSNSLHPVTDERMACHFVNVPSQEQRQGTSWKVSQCFIQLSQFINLVHRTLENAKSSFTLPPCCRWRRSASE
jgi:hypothetical protein